MDFVRNINPGENRDRWDEGFDDFFAKDVSQSVLVKFFLMTKKESVDSLRPAWQGDNNA